MATTFSTVTDWMLDRLDPDIENGGANPPGAPYEAPAGYTWARATMVLAIHRTGSGLTSFLPIVGTVVTGENISFVNGTTTIVGNAGMSWVCTNNTLEPEEQSSGFFRETRVWEWNQVWQLEGAVTASTTPGEWGGTTTGTSAP